MSQALIAFVNALEDGVTIPATELAQKFNLHPDTVVRKLKGYRVKAKLNGRWSYFGCNKATADKSPEAPKPIKLEDHEDKLFRLEARVRAAKHTAEEAKRAVTYWQNQALVSQKELDVALAIGQRSEPIKVVRTNTRLRQAVPVMVMSDWHAEEIVEKESVNGLNEYNLSIADTRIKRTLVGFLEEIEVRRKTRTIDEAVMAILGDMLSGAIHEELVELSPISPTQTILWVQERIVAGIEFLLKEGKLRRLLIPCCIGNHGRTTKKIRVSTGYRNSYEWLLYHQLALVFKADKRVQFSIPQSYLNWIEVLGKRIRLHHGDAVNFNGGIGGITIPVNRAIGDWNKSEKAWLDIFGHFHTALDGGHWVSNGSIIGYNPYALRIKAAYQPPIQQLIFVEEGRDKPVVIPVFCED